MASPNLSFSEENDSLNQNLSGINILTPGSIQGQTPFVPQPMGSPTTAPISHLPPSPGQLPMGSPTQDSKYLIKSNSLPLMGERENNLTPQGGNISLNARDGSSWTLGFTGTPQDDFHNLRKDREPSPSPESALEVSQSSTSNEFKRLFCESRNLVEHTYSLIRSFFDRSQIHTLEEYHRIIDSQIIRLAPFVSQQSENYNVVEMVNALRVIQSRIEETLISFFQNLNERDRMQIKFTLPQLRDHSYISVVNNSIHQEGNPSVNQSINNYVNESIFQSTNNLISPNSSLIKNSSKDFSHVRMSSPNKEETKVPEFNPP